MPCPSQTQLTQPPFSHAASSCEGLQELSPAAHLHTYPPLRNTVTLTFFFKMHLQGSRQVDGTHIGTSVFPQNLANERWLEYLCDINMTLLQTKFLLLQPPDPQPLAWKLSLELLDYQVPPLHLTTAGHTKIKGKTSSKKTITVCS